MNSTGLNPTTGEEYICGLIEAGTVSVDRAEEILGTYPEMAYALLFNNEKDIKRLGRLRTISMIWSNSASYRENECTKISE